VLEITYKKKCRAESPAFSVRGYIVLDGIHLVSRIAFSLMHDYGSRLAWCDYFAFCLFFLLNRSECVPVRDSEKIFTLLSHIISLFSSENSSKKEWI
jgi:hypothetical protein